MDFRRAAERYAALGSPQQVADRIRAFHAAGARHIALDLVGPYEERDRQIARVAREVFPLLADFEPKGQVARAYGVYRDHEGTTERALFVIDAGGVIRWSYVSPVGINPGADGILRALEALGQEPRDGGR